MQIFNIDRAKSMRSGAHHDHSPGRIRCREKLFLQKLSEIKMTKVVDTDLSLEAVICEFFVGQSHDASIQHQEIQSGLSGQEIRRKSFDTRKRIEVQLLYNYVRSIGFVTPVPIVSELILHSFLTRIDRTRAKDDPSTRIGKGFGCFQPNTTVTASNDGCFVCQILALAKGFDDLLKSS